MGLALGLIAQDHDAVWPVMIVLLLNLTAAYSATRFAPAKSVDVRGLPQVSRTSRPKTGVSGETACCPAIPPDHTCGRRPVLSSGSGHCR